MAQKQQRARPADRCVQIKDAIREYMASKAIRPLAQAVAAVFADAPDAGHFERRFCKYVPRNMRDSFRSIIEVRICCRSWLARAWGHASLDGFVASCG